MILRRSKAFEVRWQAERMDGLLESIVLHPRLRQLIEAPFVRGEGVLLLEPLVGQNTGPDAFQDHTGYEAFVNAFHVEDYIDSDSERRDEDTSELMRQGGKAALELSKRLEIEGMYRVVLSFEHEFPAMTLRFFESREGEPWISEDLDEYPLEGILVIDTGC